MTDNAALQFADITRTFRRSSGDTLNAVDGVDLIINPGEFVCVVGPSGCGKSTLLQLAAGLDTPTSGEVAVDGKPIQGASTDRGLVFQQDSVFPWMRVIDNVAYALKVQGVSKADRHAQAGRLLDDVGLGHVAASWPKELSGGMRKRVAIATALANQPRVLLMDEPFGALDYVTRLQLQQVVLDLWSEFGMSIMFVTHDVDEALSLADRVVVMRAGRVVDDQTIAVTRPRSVSDLAESDMVSLKARLLGHLGLEGSDAHH